MERGGLLPDKGKPVVRRGRKATGQASGLIAGLPKEGDPQIDLSGKGASATAGRVPRHARGISLHREQPTVASNTQPTTGRCSAASRLSQTLPLQRVAWGWVLVLALTIVAQNLPALAKQVPPGKGGKTVTTTSYCDLDQDGYLSASVSDTCSTSGCVPAGCSVTPGTDCDDSNIQLNPAAVENRDSDGVDNNCNSVVDERDSCSNGLLDGNETDVDCRGSCTACELGQTCSSHADCLSGNYDAGVCAETQTNLDPLCKTLKHTNGTVNNHMNLVLVPSAFNGDIEIFRQKAEWIPSIFGNYEPFDQNISRHNVLLHGLFRWTCHGHHLPSSGAVHYTG